VVIRRLLWKASVTVVLTLTVASAAHAQTANVLDQIVAQFRAQSAGWQGALTAFALNTFALLAALEMAWAAFKLAFRAADLSEWLAEVVNQFFFVGFFFLLLKNAVTWGTLIVNSFRQAASSAGGVGLAPSDVFAAGVNLAQKVISQVTSGHPRPAWV
jgi:type IV secretion system protein TrbL